MAKNKNNKNNNNYNAEFANEAGTTTNLNAGETAAAAGNRNKKNKS